MYYRSFNQIKLDENCLVVIECFAQKTCPIPFIRVYQTSEKFLEAYDIHIFFG